ncbi:RluA family pseudouridine synthase [Micrococcus lylae]|uniref:Pseudouridine synthase n=1 Tax=Micrococcus lylae TaxID=1273 RepID=A0ABY2K3W9_9MICC|nr:MULTISPECIES: RluA family pseudouridine synthase [Micrococcus]MCT2007813.1 RluA family pseudouridine synthase [Micrococcus lylae]MCT2072013.1 RluA family pseudouridine synthase [Micrococcus lylae]OFR90169.1 RNA pseudouridine synthase [Micrococcus sp. HMSC067E09]TFI00192.1 RluA family pseudouridine synthase [Micrococcus lylae]
MGMHPGCTETLEVTDEHAGRRADVVLSEAFGVSRSQLADWFSRGLVRAETRNGRRDRTLSKSAKAVPGERLVVDVPDDGDPLEVRIEPVDEMRILFEDEHMVAVDKPTGVAAHPSPGWVGPTVVGGLAALGYRISTSGAPERQGIVHRLDVGTTGVMVVAKTEQAYTALKDQFRDRVPTKVYHAVVQGLPEPLSGTIDAPIGRHPGHEWKFTVIDGGRASVTHYETLEAFGPATLVQVHLETGRTHQIRVHFSALRHPCVGDLTYGANPKLAAELGLTRQWLHAHRLELPHPVTGESVTIVSPYPDDLDHALAALRGEA